MKLSVVGTGYVGLVSGVCLAAKGHEVVCVDRDEGKVTRIQQGIPPIHEEGLDALLQATLDRSLTATTDLSRAVGDTEVTFIAVGTPFDGSTIDLSAIRAASDQIGRALKSKDAYHLVVVKSTVVPGTTDHVVRPILEEASGKKAGIDFGVAANPEFLREGDAVHDFMFPDRIVMGGMDDRSLDTLEAVYRGFPGVDCLRTNNKTAEMIKYAANSLLATMISFSNEIGNLCAAMGEVDVVDVTRAVHLDKRLTPIMPDGRRLVPSFTTYLEAGCGFGGSCFPKDVKALIAHGETLGSPMRLLQAVMRINEEQPRQVLSLLAKHFPTLRGVRIAVLGLAFKPGTDDMRESPAIPILRHLLDEGADLRAYDPAARHEAQKLFGTGHIRFCDGLEDTITDVEAVLVLTRWDAFRRLPELLRKLDPPPVLIDGRRMLDKHSVPRYEGIGL